MSQRSVPSWESTSGSQQAHRGDAPSETGGSPADWVPAQRWITELECFGYSVLDGLARVVLSRPNQRNALTMRAGEELLVIARAIAADKTVRAVLIEAAGETFTVGGDIAEFAAAPVGGLGDLAGQMTEPFHEALRVLSSVSVPIVTAARGVVAGGGLGFLYAADIVVLGESAHLVPAFAGIGLSGDGGGTWHLPRLIGAARALSVYLENRTIDARTALDWGWVAHVVDDGDLAAVAVQLATRLAAGPTVAFGVQRRLLREAWGRGLSDQLAAETEGIIRTGQTSDATDAVRAFREKRTREFKGQ